MSKIILWKDFNFKDDSFYKKIKNIKDNSLICSFSTNLQRNFFKTITRKGGKVLLALKNTTIVGLLVMEKKSSHTLDFLKKNNFKFFNETFYGIRKLCIYKQSKNIYK